MRIHHLNCGTCCPLGGRLFDGTSDGAHGRIVAHCLLIETGAGLVLVDTGFGTRDIARPRERLSAIFRTVNNIQLRPEETAIAQIRALGFDPADVRHIVISHLDFDHAGGIEDFPNATVHLLAAEMDAANRQRGGVMGRERYRPQQWDEVATWQKYRAGEGERWFGFDAVRDLAGLPPEILLVPLAGHTWGHCGVAICEGGTLAGGTAGIDRGGDTGASQVGGALGGAGAGGWLFYAADAYFFRGELGATYRCPPGMRGYQQLMEVDRAARLGNQQRLRDLQRDHGDEVRIFCAHDVVEFDLLAAAG